MASDLLFTRMDTIQSVQSSRAVFPFWQGRLAPVFDTARDVIVVDASCGQITVEKEQQLSVERPAHRALQLVELGIDTLICGAISRQLYDLIVAYDIEVTPFLAGDLREIVHHWVREDLSGDSFAMPGCRQQRWASCRRMQEGTIATVDQPAQCGLVASKGRGSCYGMRGIECWTCRQCGNIVECQYAGTGHHIRCMSCGAMMTDPKANDL